MIRNPRVWVGITFPMEELHQSLYVDVQDFSFKIASIASIPARAKEFQFVRVFPSSIEIPLQQSLFWEKHLFKYFDLSQRSVLYRPNAFFG